MKDAVEVVRQAGRKKMARTKTQRREQFLELTERAAKAADELTRLLAEVRSFKLVPELESGFATEQAIVGRCSESLREQLPRLFRKGVPVFADEKR